jgi:hypothetical protein
MENRQSPLQLRRPGGDHGAVSSSTTACRLHRSFGKARRLPAIDSRRLVACRGADRLPLGERQGAAMVGENTQNILRHRIQVGAVI